MAPLFFISYWIIYFLFFIYYVVEAKIIFKISGVNWNLCNQGVVYQGPYSLTRSAKDKSWLSSSLNRRFYTSINFHRSCLFQVPAQVLSVTQVTFLRCTVLSLPAPHVPPCHDVLLISPIHHTTSPSVQCGLLTGLLGDSDVIEVELLIKIICRSSGLSHDGLAWYGPPMFILRRHLRTAVLLLKKKT